jgi:hypothetical protein
MQKNKKSGNAETTLNQKHRLECLLPVVQGVLYSFFSVYYGVGLNCIPIVLVSTGGVALVGSLIGNCVGASLYEKHKNKSITLEAPGEGDTNTP